MKVSVILVSYNGKETLPFTLGAFSTLDCTGLEVEFLLVDNRSTDNTASLMREFLYSHNGQYIFEAKPGRSNALNAGLRKAAGDIIIFTDDDVIPDRSWLSAYADAAKAFPSAIAFAGQIRLFWPKPAKSWHLELEQRGLILGATPLDRKMGVISAGAVKGANSAIRRAAIDCVPEFRSDIGVGATDAVIAGEETAFFGGLEKCGQRIVFVPSASLLHIVREHQMSLRELLKRGVRNGRGIATIEGEFAPKSRYMLAGSPGHQWVDLARLIFYSLARLINGRHADAVEQALYAAEAVGTLQQRARIWSKTRLV